MIAARPMESDVPTEEIPLTAETVRDVLDYCRDNPTSEDALAQLNALRDWLLRPELAADVLTAAEAVTAPILAETAPRPATHAHMIILLGSLLRIDSQRDRVDVLFTAWLRHPSSYGPDRQTPPQFQQPVFVQRLADLLGWGTLSVTGDADALRRFCAWIDTWSTRNKFKIKRTLDAARRNFPAPEIWRLVRFGGG